MRNRVLAVLLTSALLSACSTKIQEVEVIKTVKVPVYQCPEPVIPEFGKLSIESIKNSSSTDEVLVSYGKTVDELLYQRNTLIEILKKYKKN